MNVEIPLLILGVIAGIVVEYFSLIWAYFEVQIEGEKSWAMGLPCWRKKYEWFSKEITGYHVSFFGFVVAIMLLVLISISIASILFDVEIIVKIVSVFKFIVLILLSLSLLATAHEDFLWNVINPSPKFGVKNYTKKYPEIGETIWIWFVPIDYIVMSFISFVLAYLVGTQMVVIWLVIFTTMLAITSVMAITRYKKDIAY